jgi:site-specific DNA-methyltransferase (adenine-specific)
MWNGAMQGKSMTEGHIMQGNKALNEKRIHPTQKPVILYDWIFKNYTQPGWKILDTHIGSGSIRISADKYGLHLKGTELSPVHFKRQEERFNTYRSQYRMSFT